MTSEELSDLRTRVAVLETQLAGLSAIVETFGPTARQVLEASLRLEDHAKRIAEIRNDIKEAEDQLHASVRRAEERIAERFESAVGRFEKGCASLSDRIDKRDEHEAQQKGAQITARGIMMAALCTGSGGIIVALLEKL